MFSSTLNSSWDERSRRGLTTLTSFGLQALVVGALLVVPLLRPAGLPSFRQISTPVSIGQPLGESPAVGMRASGSPAAPNHPVIVLRPSVRFPIGLPAAGDNTPAEIGPSGPYIPGALGTGGRDGVPYSLGSGTVPIMPVAPPAVVHSVRISHMSEGDLVRKVLPTYPPLARSARIQGQVVLQAVISKEGIIKNLRVLAGHPMLAPAAIDAVRQWRYRPYVLNNDPVEVETQITVNFSLAGN
jgi:periplasmic protein TonB